MKSKAAAVFAVVGLVFGLAVESNGPVSAQAPAQQSVAERCFEHHRFGAQSVDVAKTADGQTVLAQTRWNWHDAIGCFLTLDEQALATLRAAPPPQRLPNAPTDDSRRCFRHHKFGESPVDVAKSADGQTVLARLSWGYHIIIGCYLVLDDTALATLRGTAQPDPTSEPTAEPTPEPTPESTPEPTPDPTPDPTPEPTPEPSEIDLPPVGPQLTPVAVGRSHSCAIRADQTIACWGDNRYGQIDAPVGHFTAIAAADTHSCAIRADQTIACWGDNRYGQIDAPVGHFTAIAAADTHSCAIRADQTTACWGDNRYGQIDVPSGQFAAIATARFHSCAIRVDRTIACWGSRGSRRNDAPSGQFAAIAAADAHSCAIRVDRTIACWGYNRYGLFDLPSGQFTAVAVGSAHSCAIRTDQSIACWGNNSQGETDPPSGQFTAVAASDSHSCAIRADQTIACWGNNQSGQSSVPTRLTTPPEELLFVEVASPSEPAVDAGRSFEVVVEFNRAVRGFDAEDINVVNGDVTGFSGSGSEYKATVTAAALGTVVVMIPSAAALDQDGRSNEPSQPFARTVGTAGSTLNGEFFDTWDREAARVSAYAELNRQEPDHAWMGDIDGCVAGTTSQQYRDSIFQRINWYRQMAGVEPVVENPEYSALAQDAALIMAAQRGLSHYPPVDWACWTQTGAEGARRSNLYLGRSGASSIDGYIQDPGANNTAVGHRSWILSPYALEFGTGDIPLGLGSNALFVVAGSRAPSGTTREERGFVAWPPPGYVPPGVIWGRWSFDLSDARRTGDFSTATVEVADEYGPVDVEIIYRHSSGIVWAMDGDTNSALVVGRRPLLSLADSNYCYTVTISGAKINDSVQTPYEYAVCIPTR